MRVVVDTNVFVSACIGGGASSRLIEACLRREIEPFISASLLNEYRDVITRQAIFKAARLNESERGALLRAFISRCTWQTVHFKWRPNLRDEGDNHVMELAIASGSAIIATHNAKDFERADLKFPHIEVLRPEYVLERLSR